MTNYTPDGNTPSSQKSPIGRLSGKPTDNQPTNIRAELLDVPEDVELFDECCGPMIPEDMAAIERAMLLDEKAGR